MDFFSKGMCKESQPSHPEIIKCPFLRNINEPTNFNFASSMALPVPVRGAKGPIFEDGPNFEMSFRLFHGQNGVVPLSGRCFGRSENSDSEAPPPSPPQFNPLAARAATISLSGFGGPFGFDAFSEKWKNLNQKSKSSEGKKPSQGGDSTHEAMSNEWLQTGNCPIAKSYQAVSRVLPLVAKALQPPAGMKFKCPPAIVAARAAISKTAFAKNLRPQPLPAKVLAIGLLGMAANVPLGIWREHTKKFSPSWFVAVHAAVPFIGMLRKSILMPKAAMAFTIAASILGQVIGSRAERYRLKAVVSEKMDVVENSIDENMDAVENSFGQKMDAVENSFGQKMDAMENLFGQKMGVVENSFDKKVDVKNSFSVAKIATGHCIKSIDQWFEAPTTPARVYC